MSAHIFHAKSINSYNTVFSGTVRVKDGKIQFRAAGRNNWYFATGRTFRVNDRTWVLAFGRYGTVEIKVGDFPALDEVLNRAVARAKAAQPKTRKQVVEEQKAAARLALKARLDAQIARQAA